MKKTLTFDKNPVFLKYASTHVYFFVSKFKMISVGKYRITQFHWLRPKVKVV